MRPFAELVSEAMYWHERAALLQDRLAELEPRADRNPAEADVTLLRKLKKGHERQRSDNLKQRLAASLDEEGSVKSLLAERRRNRQLGCSGNFFKKYG